MIVGEDGSLTLRLTKLGKGPGNELSLELLNVYNLSLFVPFASRAFPATSSSSSSSSSSWFWYPSQSMST